MKHEQKDGGETKAHLKQHLAKLPPPPRAKPKSQMCETFLAIRTSTVVGLSSSSSILIGAVFSVSQSSSNINKVRIEKGSLPLKEERRILLEGVTSSKGDKVRRSSAVFPLKPFFAVGRLHLILPPAQPSRHKVFATRDCFTLQYLLQYSTPHNQRQELNT